MPFLSSTVRPNFACIFVAHSPAKRVMSAAVSVCLMDIVGMIEKRRLVVESSWLRNRQRLVFGSVAAVCSTNSRNQSAMSFCSATGHSSMPSSTIYVDPTDFKHACRSSCALTLVSNVVEPLSHAASYRYGTSDSSACRSWARIDFAAARKVLLCG